MSILSAENVGLMYPDGQPVSKTILRANFTAVGTEIQALQDQITALEASVLAEDEVAISDVSTLADVQIENLADDDALIYDSGAGKWKNIATEPAVSQIPLLIRAPAPVNYIVTYSLPFDIRLLSISHRGTGGGGKLTLALSGNQLNEFTDIIFGDTLGKQVGSGNQLAAADDSLTILLSDLDTGTTEAWFGINYERV